MRREQIEAQARSRASALYLGNDTVVATVLARFRMVLDSRDRGIVPHLCFDGFWESWVTSWVMGNVRRGEHALNLGANCGYYAVLLAELVGEAGRVLAVEPMPAHAANIWYSAHLNGYHPWLSVFEGVVGERDGDAELSWYPGMTMNARVEYEDAPENDDAAVALRMAKKTILARMKRVDDLVADWPKVDFALIDTEGAEPAVFEGMAETIARNPQFRALVEFTPSRYAEPRAFVEWVAAKGFRFDRVDAEAGVVPLTAQQLLDGGECMVLFSRDVG